MNRQSFIKFKVLVISKRTQWDLPFLKREVKQLAKVVPVGFFFWLHKMIKEPINNKEFGIYKYIVRKDVRAAYNAENSNKISKFGRKSYLSKLIDNFRKDSNSGTKEYWLEVSQ